MLASGGFDTKVKLWRVADGASLGTLAGHQEGIFSIASTGDGRSVLSASSDGTIRKSHAKSIGENSVHGSDAPETAVIEIAQFFAGNEIVG